MSKLGIKPNAGLAAIRDVAGGGTLRTVTTATQRGTNLQWGTCQSQSGANVVVLLDGSASAVTMPVAPDLKASSCVGRRVLVAGRSAADWVVVAGGDSLGGGGVPAVATFPVNPAANDRVFHTTYHNEFYYDATYTAWLATAQKNAFLASFLLAYPIQPSAITATDQAGSNPFAIYTCDILEYAILFDLIKMQYWSTASNASNCYNVVVQIAYASGAPTSLLTFNTANVGGSAQLTTPVFITKQQAEIQVRIWKTGNPPNVLYLSPFFAYRIAVDV